MLELGLFLFASTATFALKFSGFQATSPPPISEQVPALNGPSEAANAVGKWVKINAHDSIAANRASACKTLPKML